MSTVNIFDYPENATPIQLAEYQLEVMRAAERGEPAEFTSDAYKWTKWHPMRARHEQWAWDGCRYRIARPKIAEGHNPDGLTEAQVGVQDGWRLLSVEENKALRPQERPTDGIEYLAGPNSWRGNASGGIDGFTYRTKNPPGHYLPKPAAEPVAETREETRRDRIATIVRLIRDGSEPEEQIAARIDAMLAREIRPASQGGAE